MDEIIDAVCVHLGPSIDPSESYKLSPVGEFAVFLAMMVLMLALFVVGAFLLQDAHPGLQIVGSAFAVFLAFIGARLFARLLLRSGWSWARSERSE